MMNRKTAIGIRLVLFSVFPFAIHFVVAWVIWPVVYVVAPVFLPLSAYAFNLNTQEWTLLSTDHLGWPLNVAYCVFVALVATVITRKESPRSAFLGYLIITLAAAAITHVAMNLAGYTYWYDSP